MAAEEGALNDRAPDDRLRRDTAGRRSSESHRRVGQRCHRGAAARHGHSVRPAEPGLELPRVARQHRELPRQRAAADAALPARGARRRHRPWLRQGDRQAAARHRAQQCRADARVDGGLQRVVRSHAGDPDRRDGAGRRCQAPSVDRLDAHGARPGARWCAASSSGTTSPHRSTAAFESLLRATPDRARRRPRARCMSASTFRCRKRSSRRCRAPGPVALSAAARRSSPRRSSSSSAAECLAGARAAR